MTRIWPKSLEDKHFPDRMCGNLIANDWCSKEQLEVLRLSQCTAMIDAMFETMAEMPDPDALFILEALAEKQEKFLEPFKERQ